MLKAFKAGFSIIQYINKASDIITSLKKIVAYVGLAAETLEFLQKRINEIEAENTSKAE